MTAAPVDVDFPSARRWIRTHAEDEYGRESGPRCELVDRHGPAMRVANRDTRAIAGSLSIAVEKAGMRLFWWNPQCTTTTSDLGSA
jgi:hypothetical protein